MTSYILTDVIHLCRHCKEEIKVDIDIKYDRILFETKLKTFPNYYKHDEITNSNMIIRSNFICDNCK